MKKLLSILLTVLMMFSVLSGVNVFAEEKYPPVETGSRDWSLNAYEYETAGDNPTPITLDESFSMQLSVRKNPIPLNDTELENQIKEDFVASKDNEVTVEQLDVDYYGTLSDGSMLVFLNGPFYYDTIVDYTVIGKYVYITSCRGNDIKIYKNNTFTSIVDAYQSGSLTDELLDELAVKLSFAKFVNPNEQKTQETTASVDSTPDTAPNNSNGSIPTGHSNIIILLAVAILGISFVALCLAKSKRAL